MGWALAFFGVAAVLTLAPGVVSLCGAADGSGEGFRRGERVENRAGCCTTFSTLICCFYLLR